MSAREMGEQHSTRPRQNELKYAVRDRNILSPPHPYPAQLAGLKGTIYHHHNYDRERVGA